jgi:hypothetical protein
MEQAALLPLTPLYSALTASYAALLLSTSVHSSLDNIHVYAFTEQVYSPTHNDVEHLVLALQQDYTKQTVIVQLGGSETV